MTNRRGYQPVRAYKVQHAEREANEVVIERYRRVLSWQALPEAERNAIIDARLASKS